VVQLAQFYGLEMNAHLVLEDKPTRQDQKLKKLSKYLQQHPSGWKKRLELADLLCSTGNWPQAVQEYRQVLQRQPQLMEVQLQLGKILHLMGRKAEAIEVYQSALFLSDNVATQHHVNGLIEVCRCCPQQAVRMFESAASTEPNNPAHWYALAQVHLDMESPVTALRAFDAVLSINSDDIVALSQSYDPLLAVGNFQEAQRRLERSLKLAPNDCRTLERLVAHRCHQGLVSGEAGKQTKQLIQTVLRVAPDAANPHQALSLYHIRRGEWSKGVAVLQKFTEEHPNSPSGWYHYALSLFQTGNSQSAAEAILKAHTLYQNDCEIYRALCEILPAAERLEELRLTSPPTLFLQGEGSHALSASPTPSASPASLLEKMLQRFPQRWSVWVTAGRVLVESFSDSTRGCTFSAKAVQLQPQLADSWFRHGRVLALAGRHQEAVVALEQGWQQLPQQGSFLQSVPAAVWLGESYQVLGESAISRRWWEEACHRANALMDYNPATAYYWQGRALSALGDGTGAKQAYRNGLSQQLLYPVRSEVMEALKRL
jgi:tetratricopeptide (TPR) repeat protein